MYLCIKKIQIFFLATVFSELEKQSTFQSSIIIFSKKKKIEKNNNFEFISENHKAFFQISGIKIQKNL